MAEFRDTAPLSQLCFDENASFLLLSNLISRLHNWWIGNQQGMGVADFLSLYIYTADAMHVKVVLGLGIALQEAMFGGPSTESLQ